MKFIITAKKMFFFAFFFVALFYISSTFTMQNTKGDTTLFLAIEKNNYFMLKHYLEQGENPNVRYSKNETPIFYATAIKSIDQRIIQTLLTHGADPNIPNRIGNTPLHNAVTDRRLSIVTLLLAHGANPTLKNIPGYSPLDWAREANLKRFIGPLSIRSLIQAIENDNLEQAIQALKDGAKVNFPLEDINTAAQLALQQKRISILNEILSRYPYSGCGDIPLAVEVPSQEHLGQPSHFFLTAAFPKQKISLVKRFFKILASPFQ